MRETPGQRTRAAVRKLEIFEKAKSFEERVAELFRFLGYTTILDYQKDDLQFDVRLEMTGGPLPVFVLVECKDTGKPIGQKQVREFASKVEHARKADVQPYQAIIVSRSGFVNNAHEVARRQFVHLRTFDQLILSLVDFGPNLEEALNAFHRAGMATTYVEQEVVLQRGTSTARAGLRAAALTATVLSWLERTEGTFLALLGDFGSGKTTFCRRLASELATRVRKQPGSARIPVVIDLRSGGSTTVTLENLLTHHFQCLSSQPINPQSLLYLNREGYLVLLFDGFDEVIAYSEPSRYVDNLRQILRAAEGRAKIILTCRTHYFRDQPEEVRHLGNTPDVLSTAGATRLYEELTSRQGVDIAYLREFSDQQIDDYLKRALRPPTDWREFRQQIWRTYHLHDLAQRPFLLAMIVKTLPQLVGASPGDITLADLYEIYCESWFDHTDFRLTMTREHKVGLVEHLARAIWDAPEQRVHYQALFTECIGFFSSRALTPDEKDRIDFEVRTALFLRRDAAGFYSFIHRSFLEFFVARALRTGIAAKNPACLDCRHLTQEVAYFLSFWPEAEQLVELAGEVLGGAYRPRISENALQLLYLHARSSASSPAGEDTESWNSEEVWHQTCDRFRRLRPRSIHLAGADLAGSDLRGACLDGADLAGASLHRAKLQGASLRGARLERATLAFCEASTADFTGAHLAQADLAHANCSAAVFLDADLAGSDLSFATIAPALVTVATSAILEALEAGRPRWLDLAAVTTGTVDIPLARRLTVVFEGAQPELKLTDLPGPQALAPVPQGHLFPTSPGQRRFWFLSRLAPATYTRCLGLELRGSLSVGAFRMAVGDLVRRHQILTSTFHLVGSELLQRISTATIPITQVIDLRSIAPARRLHTVRQLVSQQAEREPSLEAVPVFRAMLLVLEQELHVALLVSHKIIADQRSEELLLDELCNLTASFSLGRPAAPVLDTKIQFRNLVHWQRQERSAVVAADLAYWREQLGAVPPTMDLPTDRPRTRLQSLRGASRQLRLTADLSHRLRTLALRLHATTAVASLTAFCLVLGRYAARNRAVIGMQISGRQYAVLESMIGPLDDTLVLHTEHSRARTLTELLEQVRETVLAGYAHGELSFAQLVEDLLPDRSLSHSPIFQARFATRPETRILGTGPLTAALVSTEPVTAEVDLDLSLVAGFSDLAAELLYCVDLYDATTVDRLLRHFQAVLERMVVSTELPLETMSFLTEAELHQTVVEWNDTTRQFAPATRCLHELFEAQARRTPLATAVSFEGETLTYRQLDVLAGRWARHLQRLGVGPEVLVALFLERSLDMVVGLLAVLKAGGAYVPLDPAYPSERLAFSLQDARPPVVLTQRRFLDALPPFEAHVVCLDRTAASEGPNKRLQPRPQVCPDNLCYMIYTSGSTGRPKGVLNTHRGIVNRLMGMQAAYELTATDRVLHKTTYAFDISVWELFWPLVSGATLVLARPGGQREGIYLADVIREERITTVHFVPSFLQSFLDQVEVEADCRSLRQILVSGEALSPALQERLFGWLGKHHLELHVLYGPTEAAIDVTALQLPEATSTAPIGRPVPNSRIYLLDHKLRPVPISVPGQLWIGGAQLARGYHSVPSLTAERFCPDPFSGEPGARLYATGDMARFDRQGLIEYLGRIDRQVKLRGFRIELGEIESALARHPAVLQSVVVVRETIDGERRIVAYVALRGDTSPPSAGELREFLQALLPEYMVPARFIVLTTLPLTASGKVDRRSLPDLAATPENLSHPYLAPRSAIESTIADIWRDVLGVERVGVHDSFFELGGHSLLAMRVIARAQHALQIEVPLRLLFDRPTLADFANAIENATGASRVPPPL
jgi:amino acid adenylation domain-containing protein